MSGLFRWGVFSAALLVALFLGAPADAGFTDVSCEPLDGLTITGWDWGTDGGSTWLTMDELVASLAGGVIVSGETDEDAAITVTKDITNSTSYTWIGYSILLDPLDTDTFIGVPSSDGTSGGMTLVNQTAYALDWGTPNAVQPGQTVTFTFQVNVPDTGPFGFTLTQMPTIQEFNIPEPATISLIGLAVLMVVGIGRKRFR